MIIIYPICEFIPIYHKEHITILNRNYSANYRRLQCDMLAFRSIWDVLLFLRASSTDQNLDAFRSRLPVEQAFDLLYDTATENDPWSVQTTRSRYQERKYADLLKMLPKRKYQNALDIGCGTGFLTEGIAQMAEKVLGIDISVSAITHAAARLAHHSNLEWSQGNVTDLDVIGDRTFDLAVIADTIYYLDRPISDTTLDMISDKVASLLERGGTLLLANHYFFFPNADTRLTNRIHNAFKRCNSLELKREYRRAFYKVSIFEKAP